jgi:hypothetical protein
LFLLINILIDVFLVVLVALFEFMLICNLAFVKHALSAKFAESCFLLVILLLRYQMALAVASG